MSISLESQSKSRGPSLWTAFRFLLILTVASLAALGALFYYWKADKEHTRRRFDALQARQARADVERLEAAQAGQLTQAGNRQKEVLAQARHATNVLGRLWSGTQQLQAEASALRTNGAGSKIALHAELVATARRFYESELRGAPSVDEMASKLENARRIEQQMVSALGTTYEPEPAFAAALQNDLLWSAAELRQMEGRQALLRALIQEAQAKVGAPTMIPEPPTLEAAIAQLAQTESVIRQRMIAEATEQAKPQALQLLAEAERERILQEARLQVTNVLSEVRVLLAQQNQARLTREAEFQRGVETTQLQVSNVVLAIAEMRRQHERDTTVREAKQQVEDTQARLRREELQEQARNLERRRKAQDPRLQALLAPFLTPGYQQYFSRSYEKQPFSYKELQTVGALIPNFDGLRRLVGIAMFSRFNERPRWQLRGGLAGWSRIPESIELVKEAQQALIELGPVMVEMGMLAP